MSPLPVFPLVSIWSTGSQKSEAPSSAIWPHTDHARPRLLASSANPMHPSVVRWSVLCMGCMDCPSRDPIRARPCHSRKYGTFGMYGVQSVIGSRRSETSNGECLLQPDGCRHRPVTDTVSKVPIGDLSICSEARAQKSVLDHLVGRARSMGGTVWPSALPVLRLIRNPRLAGCSTGRSERLPHRSGWSVTTCSP
jgi:hypothetical protein